MPILRLTSIWAIALVLYQLLPTRQLTGFLGAVILVSAAALLWALCPRSNADAEVRRIELQMTRVPGNAIRWTIGPAEGRHGTMWRLWGNKKGDFYVAARSMGGILKTSFHKDGNCHSGFTSEYALKAGIANRHMDRWKLVDSPPFRALQVLTPSSDLRVYSDVDPTDHAARLPAPPAGHLGVVTIFISSTPPGDLDTLAPPPSAPIGILATKNRFCWAVYATNAVSPSVQSHIDLARAEIESNAAARATPRTPGIRTLIVAGNGSDRTVWELAWDHPEGQ